MEIMSKFNLPTYVKGKSFSEASAMIAKKFKDRNSPEDVATLNDLQGRLQQAQEFVKAQQEARTNPTHQMPDGSMMNGSSHQQQASNIPADAGMGAEPSGFEPASNQYEGGGFATSQFGAGLQEGASGGAISGTIGAGLGGISALADMGKTAFGKTGIDTSGATAAPDVPSRGASAATGAMKGASAGMAFGPWGAAIGGVLGGVSGLIGGGKANRDADEASVNNDFAVHNAASNSYKGGGKLLANMYDAGGHAHPHNTTDPKSNSLLDDVEYSENWWKNFDMQNGLNQPKAPSYEDSENLAKQMRSASNSSSFTSMGLDDASLDEMESNDKFSDMNTFSSQMNAYNTPKSDGSNADDTKPESKFNPGELLRYAPTAMNAIQLAGLKKPGQVGLDRLGNRYNEQLVDERGMQNTVQQGVLNNRDAILSSSGGSGSSARASLLASQLQGQKAQSQAYQQAGVENRQEKRAGQQFNLNVDQANLGQSNQETMTNLSLKAGYESNKSKLMSQLGNDLGGIGQEELFKRYPELMGLSYGSKGQHLASEERNKKARKASRNAKN